MNAPTPKHWDSLCEIFVPTDDDQDGQGNSATAYPIATDRVITCSHVLDGLHRGRVPEVRWHHLEPDGGYRPLNDDFLLFDGRKHDVDAAVLKVPLPEKATHASLLPGCPPIGTATHCLGFPRVGRKVVGETVKRNAVPIDGQLLSYAEAQRTFSVGLIAEHDVPTGWRGASGAPVFVGGKLVGVLVECPHDFANKRLSATPLYRLLGIPEFKEAIDFDQRLPCFAGLRTAAVRLLAEPSDVTAELVHVLQQAYGGEHSGVTAAESVFASLVALDAVDALERLLETRRNLDSAEKHAAVERLEQLALAMLPVVFRCDDIERLWEVLRDWNKQPILLSVETGSLTMAEAIMSGATGRTMQLKGRPREPKDDLYGEEYLINPPPDSGIDPGKVAHRADFNVFLSGKLLGRKSAQLTTDDLVMIRDDLEVTRTHDATHFYVLYRTTVGEADVPEEIAILSNEFPHIAFLGIKAKETVTDHKIRIRFNRLRIRRS